MSHDALYRKAHARLSACALILISGLLTAPAHAAGSNMPWEAPLQNLLDSVQGPVVRIFAVLIIAITGLTLAFGDTSGGFRKLIQVVFGLSIAFAATSFFLGFFGYAGGATVS
jgi:type IV secretory pathway VirB2 component (pilin)